MRYKLLIFLVIFGCSQDAAPDEILHSDFNFNDFIGIGTMTNTTIIDFGQDGYDTYIYTADIIEMLDVLCIFIIDFIIYLCICFLYIAYSFMYLLITTIYHILTCSFMQSVYITLCDIMYALNTFVNNNQTLWLMRFKSQVIYSHNIGGVIRSVYVHQYVMINRLSIIIGFAAITSAAAYCLSGNYYFELLIYMT